MPKQPLRIYTYKGKNEKYYKITYYRGVFYFVHISKEKICECIRAVKNGKRHLEYYGDFTFTEDKKGIII